MTSRQKTRVKLEAVGSYTKALLERQDQSQSYGNSFAQKKCSRGKVYADTENRQLIAVSPAQPASSPSTSQSPLAAQQMAQPLAPLPRKPKPKSSSDKVPTATGLEKTERQESEGAKHEHIERRNIEQTLKTSPVSNEPSPGRKESAKSEYQETTASTNPVSTTTAPAPAPKPRGVLSTDAVPSIPKSRGVPIYALPRKNTQIDARQLKTAEPTGESESSGIESTPAPTKQKVSQCFQFPERTLRAKVSKRRPPRNHKRRSELPKTVLQDENQENLPQQTSKANVVGGNLTLSLNSLQQSKVNQSVVPSTNNPKSTETSSISNPPATSAQAESPATPSVSAEANALQKPGPKTPTKPARVPYAQTAPSPSKQEILMLLRLPWCFMRSTQPGQIALQELHCHPRKTMLTTYRHTTGNQPRTNRQCRNKSSPQSLRNSECGLKFNETEKFCSDCDQANKYYNAVKERTKFGKQLMKLHRRTGKAVEKGKPLRGGLGGDCEDKRSYKPSKDLNK
ncbi:hypothetical protein BJ742DRAFT_895495 [Cladochytrium replicatum]|nr:hypothetical protein BJ742DRAFT_895495 [Cladochytrium replicatum]